MRDPAAAYEQLARTSLTRIPDASECMAHLIADYESSKLAKFHDWFYSQEQHEADRWPRNLRSTCRWKSARLRPHRLRTA